MSFAGIQGGTVARHGTFWVTGTHLLALRTNVVCVGSTRLMKYGTTALAIFKFEKGLLLRASTLKRLVCVFFNAGQLF